MRTFRSLGHSAMSARREMIELFQPLCSCLFASKISLLRLKRSPVMGEQEFPCKWPKMRP